MSLVVPETAAARVELPSEILGPRVLLRPYRESDADALWEAIDESRLLLAEWMPWVDEYNVPSDAAPSIRRMAARWLLREDLVFGMFDRHSGRMLGGSGLPRMDWTIRRFEIGYWVRQSATRQGYATEATQVLTRFAFGTLDACRVEVRMDARNTHSQAIPVRLGFTYEGRLRQAHRDVHQQPADLLVYSLLPDEFASLPWRTGGMRQ